MGHVSKNHDMKGRIFAYVPIDAYFIITRRCNFDCRYCIRESMATLPADMLVARFNSILQSLKGLTVRKIILTGGEPLLYSKIDKILEYVTDSYNTVVCTNGWFLSERLTNLIQKQRPNVSFQISLDAVGDKYDAIVNMQGAFEKVIQGIKFANNHNIKPIISTTVRTPSFDEIIELFGVIKEFAIDTWKISPEMPCPQSNGENMLSDADRWNVLVKKVQKLEKLGGIQKLACDTMFSFRNQGQNQQISSLAKQLAGCEAGKKKVYFRTDGSISLCPLLDRYKVYSPKQDFASWWSSSKELLEFREFQIAKLNECSVCDWLEICKGGCHGTALYKYQSIFRADPRCPIAKLKE